MKGMIFVYALTYGGSVVALFRPYYGVLIYICFACLRPEYLWFWSVPPGNYSRIVAIATLAGWAFAGFGNWRLGAAKDILLLLLGYWVWVIASALLAPNQETAWNFVILHTKILVPIVVGLTLVHDTRQLRTIAWSIVACLGYLALETNRQYVSGGLQVRDFSFGAMDNNSFCIAMVTGSSVAFFLGLSEQVWWRKALALAAAALMAHTPMFLMSRGGLLGLIVAGAATFVLLPKRPATLVVWAAALLVAMRLAGPAVVERFGTSFASAEDRDDSAQSRLELWADCWDVMKKNPLFGAGPDHWPLLAADYGWPPGKEAHSLLLNTGAELGFPGVFLLGGMYAMTMWRCWKLARDPLLSDPWLRDLGRMAVAGLASFVTSASFVALDALEVPYFVVLLGAGAVSVGSRNSAPADVGQRDERFSVAPARASLFPG